MSARSRRAAFAAAIALLAAALTAAAADPAAAHRYPDYYVYFDQSGHEFTSRWGVTTIPWQFDIHYAGSGSTWDDRTTEAFRVWRDATQSHLFFNKVGSDALVTHDICEASDTKKNGISVVRRATLPAGARGLTT